MSINNVDVKIGNISNSDLISKNQPFEKNNVNYQLNNKMKIFKSKKKNYRLNKRKKSQDYPKAKEKEEEKEKDTKSSCCLIKIYKYINSHFLESRQVTPFALTILTLVNILINLIIFVCSLICSSIDLNPKTPYFYELMNNWASRPISSIFIKSDKNDITENSDWYNFKRWEGRNLQLNYLDTNYNLTLFNSIYKKGKKCGRDSIGNELYFENNTCPINDIIINNEKELKNKRYNYTTIPLENGKYFHYTNEKTDGTIYVQILIRGEKNACENNVFENINDICFYLDNCYVNNSLYNKSDCYQLNLYKAIDKMNFGDFQSDNGLNEISEKYTKSDEVSLNVRGWVGINAKGITYINIIIKYFEFYGYKYYTFKWQLLMTIVSILKTIFLTLNNHFEWIKPWNKILITANIAATLIIFLFEIGQKILVLKGIKAYYFLYNYIYTNLEGNYPILTKKAIIRLYYYTLQSGYIIKIVGDNISWTDYYKYYDKCNCPCKNCQDRNCVKCKKKKCIINGVKCSCDCEKCKKNYCFLCEGSGSRELTNFCFKKRCDIYLKFSVKGWKSIKIITFGLILFIIFIPVFILIYVKNNHFSFV